MIIYKFISIILLIPTFVFAEAVTVNKPVICDRAGVMMQYLAEKHGEVPIWLGSKEKSTVTILANPKTQSWTIIHFQGQEDIACILETGIGFQFMFLNPT